MQEKNLTKSNSQVLQKQVENRKELPQPDKALNEKTTSIASFLKNIYLFIWLCWVLVAAGGLLSCGM